MVNFLILSKILSGELNFLWFVKNCRDRKRKRFVGQTGKEANLKKVKTESGRKIAASYKTQLYQRWRERHKIDSLTAGGDEDTSRGGSEGGRGERRGRWRGAGKDSGESKRARVGDLKTSDQILKKRKKRAFQAARRLRKQGRTANNRGRGRGRGKSRN